MASTAALLANLQSFDSSDAGQESRAVAGITFGSVAESFHSDENDQDALEREQLDRAAVAGKGREREEEFSSIMEEEEMPGDEDDEEEVNDRRPTHQQQQQTRTNGPPPPRTASSLSAATRTVSSQSSRLPSASTAPTDSPGVIPSSLVDMSGPHDSKSDADSSQMLQNLEMGDSVRSRDIGSWGARDGNRGAGQARAGPLDAKRRTSGDSGVPQSLTLREQEKVIDVIKKENFALKLKIHFYEQRLERLAPDQIDLALKENVQLKVEFQTLRTELKRYRKLLLEGNRAIESLTRERDAYQRNGAGAGSASRRERELEKDIQRRIVASEREKSDRETLEMRVREQARELHELRDQAKRRRDEEPDAEGARAEIERLRDDLDKERGEREDLLGDQDDLQMQLREAHDALEEAQEEIQRLKQEAREDRSSMIGDNSGIETSEGRRTRDKEIRRQLEKLERKVIDLEQDNTSLRSQITAQITMLSARNEEKEKLKDELEARKQDILNLENELDRNDRERKRHERSQDSNEDEKSRDQLERENDGYRDRAAALALSVESLKGEIEEKEREIEELLQDLETRDAEHATELRNLEDDFENEMRDLKAGAAEAKDKLEEKEEELQDLADKTEGLMAEIADRDADMAADAEEIAALTADLKNLAQQVDQGKDDIEDRDARIEELETELDALDRELADRQSQHDQVVDALKEKLAHAKARLSELSIQHESLQSEVKFSRDQLETLALRNAELEEQSRRESESRRALEEEADELTRALRKEEEERDLDQQEWNRQREEEENKWNGVFDQKDRDLNLCQSELVKIKSLVEVRESDVQKLQDALNGLQSESQRLGESHTNDRFSLEIELDRLKRDLARHEADLEERSALLREKDMALATLTSEAKDLASQLASQMQTRIALTDKFDVTAKSLREAQEELSSARERLEVVENQLNTDHRALSRTEAQYRDQLSERNTLLLNIYQQVDKIVLDKSPRKAGQADLKPFTNFTIFHDALLARIKNVTLVSVSFERRTKEIECKFGEQIVSLKRQLESRLRQLDRFETSIKAATDTQRQWRQRLATKQLELDSAKATNTELQTQIASLRQRASIAGVDPGTSAKVSLLTTRASTAEKRLAAYQTQLASAEEKLSDARAKVAVAEGKWEARLRELEARNRAAEEKLKRERQGAKERVAELAETIQNLKGQVSGALRRDRLLGDVISTVGEGTEP